MHRIGRLHVLTDFTFQQRYSHAEQALMAIKGGAEVIQFRQKHGSIRDMYAEAMAVKKVCKHENVTFLVNDRVDLALAVGADGVHLGQTDLPVSAARRILGPGALIGVTAPDRELARRAEEQGADYVGFGPVFLTRSKANPTSVKGVGGLQKFCGSVSLPVIAIAGITVDRTAEVLEAGAHGIAVMTAISLAQYPEIETQKFSLALMGQHD